jgi:uncharacterized protein
VPRLRRVLSAALVVAAVIVAGYAALVALVWWSQERIVFQPPAGFVDDAAVLSQKVNYQAADGQQLYAYLVAPARGDRPPGEPPEGERVAQPRGLLIVFHGNADVARSWTQWALRASRHTGYAVLVPEFRGYAGLPGTPTYEGSRLDARAAYAFARDSLGVRPSDVAIYGHSLGSAIGAELAAEVRPRALLLEAPFTSARAMARLIVARPVVALWRVISRVHYDTEARVRELEAPVHVVHGDRDGVIPVHMGHAVHAAARERGALLVVHGAGHNDVHETGGGDYWRWLERALGRPADD